MEAHGNTRCPHGHWNSYRHGETWTHSSRDRSLSRSSINHDRRSSLHRLPYRPVSPLTRRSAARDTLSVRQPYVTDNLAIGYLRVNPYLRPVPSLGIVAVIDTPNLRSLGSMLVVGLSTRLDLHIRNRRHGELFKLYLSSASNLHSSNPPGPRSLTDRPNLDPSWQLETLSYIGNVTLCQPSPMNYVQWVILESYRPEHARNCFEVPAIQRRIPMNTQALKWFAHQWLGSRNKRLISNGVWRVSECR